jgi:serine/threonine protein kinase
VIGFRGACWGVELLCLVLEWVARGTLKDLLEDPAQLLCWADPLLRLSQDLVRGMAYLHQRQYFDECDGKVKCCIIHRDLKSENALVTDFMTCKLTDFGTSRAKGAEDITMTAVGTPLFVAPEIALGDEYDEAVDVYSFGMTLIDIATGAPILEFIGERWCAHFDKTKAPKNPMRMILAMQSDGWRPVTTDNPISFAPSTINSLIVRCCAQDPRERPTFPEIFEEINGCCKEEVERGMFLRRPAALGRRRGGHAPALGTEEKRSHFVAGTGV